MGSGSSSERDNAQHVGSKLADQVTLVEALLRTLLSTGTISEEEVDKRRAVLWKHYATSDGKLSALLKAPPSSVSSDGHWLYGKKIVELARREEKILSSPYELLLFGKRTGALGHEGGQSGHSQASVDLPVASQDIVDSARDEVDLMERYTAPEINQPQFPECAHCAGTVTSSKELYHDLPDESWIRLLTIEPGSFHDQVNCSLHCAVRKECKGSYEAVSYSWHEYVYWAWTPNTDDHDVRAYHVRCNGAALKVQPNLWCALRQIREKDRSRTIWVDALCINQANDLERNIQVQHMASVYQNARRTLIWLGAGCSEESSRDALKVLGQVVNTWDTSKPAHFWEQNLATAQWTRHECEGPPTNWQDLSDLFSTGWFRRKWVIQEVVMSNSSVVLWGRHKIAWRWVGLAAALLRTQRDDIVRKHQLNSVYNAYLMFRLSRTGNSPPVELTFLQLLRLSASFQSSERRDVIFALLGLETKDHHPTESPFVRVDYTQSVEALYISIADKLLQQPEPLKLLSDADYNPDKGQSQPSWRSSTPLKDSSWIPRWGSRTASLLTPWSIGDSFSPAKGLPFQRFPNEDPLILEVSGVKVSTVMFCTATLERDGKLDNFIATILPNPRLLTDPDDPDAAEVLLNVLARTLTAGRDEYGNRARNKSEFLPHFVRYLEQSWLLDDYHGFEAGARGSEDIFAAAACRVCEGRRLFVSATGQIGLGPWSMHPGDFVYVLGGAEMPFVLRKEGGHFRVLGECYVDDIMDGQAVEAINASKPLKTQFDPKEVMERLFRVGGLSSEVQKEVDRLKRDVLEATRREYSSLRVESVKIR